MMRKIAFGGHYNLGEKIREVQLETLIFARAENCPMGILIGDIDFNQKVAAYILTGIDGVKESYRKRLARNPSGCVRRQIPTEEELDDVIDEEQYDFISAMLESKTPRLYQALQKTPLDIQETELTGIHQSLARVIREELILPLTIRRLWAYELRRENSQNHSRPEVRLYSERELKNIVAKRMRPSREGTDDSWRHMSGTIKSPLLRAFFDEVQTPNGIPACRGILLALYELLTKEGFTECHQHYSTRDERAVQHTTDLYNALHEEFPKDPRWQLAIKKTFYEEQPIGGTNDEDSGYC